MKSWVNMKNEVKISVFENWKLKNKFIYPNITCKAGRTSLAKRIIDFSPEEAELWVVKYIAVWDDNSTPTENDTTLNNEIARVAITQASCTFTDNVVKVYATFPVWTTLTIREAWLFIDSTATTSADSWKLLCHSAFWVTISKTSIQAITIEWTIAILNS